MEEPVLLGHPAKLEEGAGKTRFYQEQNGDP